MIQSMLKYYHPVCRPLALRSKAPPKLVGVLNYKMLCQMEYRSDLYSSNITLGTAEKCSYRLTS